MAKKSFKPQNLRTLLAFILVATILGGGALFYFGLQTVKTYAVSVNQRLEDANASERNIEQLQVLKGQLAQSETLISKADQLFSTNDTYQARALTDIQNYANQTGLSVRETAFEAPGGTNLHIIVVKLTSPTSYQKLIQFLTLVEGNLPKMQVNSIDLKHAKDGTADSVEVGDIKINILVR